MAGNDDKARRAELGRAVRPGIFDPAAGQATLDYGRYMRRRSGDIAFDPAEALRFWQEIGTAWLRLWQPFLAPADPAPRYTFFLSHAKDDEDRVAAFRARIDALPGVTAFVDWIDAPGRDRAQATPGTARWLRETMRRSEALILLLSPRSAGSFWVQWELGFFDALRGRVFIVDLEPEARDAVARQEYVGLYPTFETPDALLAALGEFTGRPAAAS